MLNLYIFYTINKKFKLFEDNNITYLKNIK